jgi:hypothetical protein
MWKLFKNIIYRKNLAVGEPDITYHNILVHDFEEQVLNETIDPLIWEEFADKLKNTEQRYLGKLLREINVLQNNYDLVMLVIQEIKLHRRIKSIRPEVELPNLDEIWKVLMNIIPVRKTDTPEIIGARSKKLMEQINMKRAEIKRIQPIAQGGGKLDRSYFTKMIANVSTYHKMQINKRVMLLSEFVEYILIMREQQQEMEKEIQKQGKKI